MFFGKKDCGGNFRSGKIFALLVLLVLLPVAHVFAATHQYNERGYDIKISYNDSAHPGDAVFVRLDISTPDITISSQKATGTLVLYVNGSASRKASFYSLKDIGEEKSLLAGIPLSTWWTPEVTFRIGITCTVSGKQSAQIELPFRLIEKKFDSDTLYLNSSNTSIITNTSTEKKQQSDRLSEIIWKINPSSVYQASAFTPPTESKRFTSYFGDRRVYSYSTGGSSTSEHYGNDYGIPTGSSVKACASGKVVLAEWRIATGYSVVVEHLPGLYSLYYHMSELKCKEGDIVKVGDEIGKSGATGLATGPHLHWEVRLNGYAVDPIFFTSDFAFQNK